MRTEYMRELRRWRGIQRLDSTSLARMQRNALQHLLRHATTNVAYYHDLAIPSSGDPHEWLRRFPLLTKSHLRDHEDQLRDPRIKRVVKVSSSGSSGMQSTLWVTPREMSRSQAIQTLWWEWAGYRHGHQLLQTGITPDRGFVKRFKDTVLNTDYVVAFGLTDAEMVEILRRTHDGGVFGGYASSLDAFARAGAEAGINGPRFRSACSWGDKLFPQFRDHVRQQFGAEIYDSYGTSEGFMIAAQRDPSGPYQVMSPHVVVELLDDDDQPVPDGEMGRVVVTRLDGFATPLIRFVLGDLAQAPSERIEEEHGLSFPQLERIIGRETDAFRSPGGRTLTVHTFTGVMEHFAEIQQFCVVPGDGAITIEYIPAPGMGDAVLERADAALNEAVGEDLSVTWTEVDHIGATPSGKPQIIRPGLPT